MKPASGWRTLKMWGFTLLTECAGWRYRNGTLTAPDGRKFLVQVGRHGAWVKPIPFFDL